jgi:hypothetical protein
LYNISKKDDKMVFNVILRKYNTVEIENKDKPYFFYFDSTGENVYCIPFKTRELAIKYFGEDAEIVEGDMDIKKLGEYLKLEV